MSRAPARLILVTGPPRSGTTVVGWMLSLGRGVCTLYEPFNYHVGLKEVERYFEVPGAATFSVEKFDACVQRLKTLDLSYKPGVYPGEARLRQAVKYVIGGRAMNSYRRCRLTPSLHTIVWKDPFASFMADRLSTVHGTEVVVTLRNPWAVAASFKRMGWGFDLDDLHERLRVLSLEDPPHGSGAWAKRGDSALNGVLLWCAIYGAIGWWAKSNPRIHMVDLDDVVAAPQETYAKLFRLLDLPWDVRIGAKIASRYASSSERAVPREQKAHDTNRDPQSINRYWVQVLDRDEEAMVSEVAQPLWEALRETCV